MDQEREREIIKRVLDGDRQAFARLINTYKRPIFNLAYRMTGCYQDADDLTQEIFIRVYWQLPKFHQDKKFFTWLYTISLNQIRNHLKKKARDILSWENGGKENVKSCPDESNDPSGEETIQQLESLLLMLPVDLREAIVLKFNFDLTFEEMAAITGSSVSALKMRVYRGLDKLRNGLKMENNL